MKKFSQMLNDLRHAATEKDQIAILSDYFSHASESDRLWALALFLSRQPKKQIKSAELLYWAREWSGLPAWLFEECQAAVSDASELAALVALQDGNESHKTLSEWMDFVLGLENLTDEGKPKALKQAWSELNTDSRFVLNQIFSGNFRHSVSQTVLTSALSHTTNLPATTIAHRLLGDWHPTTNTFQDLFFKQDEAADPSRPYPFFLGHVLTEEPQHLGDVTQWCAEWKWDGLRVQVVVRGGEVFVWNREQELVTPFFPEFSKIKDFFPNGTVLDGVILARKDREIAPFADLEARLQCKSANSKIRAQTSVVFMACDVLEAQGQDVRSFEFRKRREILQSLSDSLNVTDLFRISPLVQFSSWEELDANRKRARENQSVGLVLKQINSPYESSRKKGHFWKWPCEPLTVAGVLLYAEREHDGYGEYTFGVWNRDELVPFAKTDAGLSEEEVLAIHRYVQDNTQEKFGPVRTVKPGLVFEIAFDGIQVSKRRKSGVTVRLPRVLRWHHDKPVDEADTLERLHQILEKQIHHKT